MTTLVSNKYALKELDPQFDRSDVLGLWRRNLPSASAARYGWLYERGPASGWVLLDETGRCVGSAGIMMRTVSLDGSDVNAGQTIDLNVDLDHRTVGPAVQLQRAVAGTLSEHGLRLLLGFPNKKSDPVQTRIGYRPLGVFDRWVKPLRSRSLVRRYVRTPVLAEAVAGMIDLGLRCSSRDLLTRRSPGTTFDETEWFDERFDDLWQRARTQYRFVGHRTSDYLNWRFAACPDATHRTLLMRGADGLPIAYVVYCRLGNDVSIGDVFTADAVAIEPLLAEFIRRMRSEEIDSIAFHCLGPPAMGLLLQKLGFLHRPSSWRVLILPPLDCRNTAAPLMNASNWWLTRADLDTDC